MGIRRFLSARLRALRGATSSARATSDVLAEPPSAAPEPRFIAVGRSEQVTAGAPQQFEAFGRAIAVFRADGMLYAIDNTCLHEDGPLGEGQQDGFVVTCAYHNWRYDVRDGRCLTDPGRCLAWHPVRERDGVIWVGPASGESSRDRGGEHDDGLKTV